ncbi:putative STE family protein kinase [Blattamonas nauphoetae]|uniref:STE family protein kinase n=1 Tax=Blattamonas nauphoetae TaxID=2049346 RepID=A0ABQ9YK22_9EUKA|nr:putative STE family protein kinase [Blattamonas nauphoetae]
MSVSDGDPEPEEYDSSGRKVVSFSPTHHSFRAYDKEKGREIAWHDFVFTSDSQSSVSRANQTLIHLQTLNEPTLVRFVKHWFDYEQKILTIITEATSSGSIQDFIGIVKIGGVGLGKGATVGFGVSSILKKDLNADSSDVAVYAAPEAMGGRVSAKSDVYSFGMCMLKLQTGVRPYAECETVEQLNQRRAMHLFPESLSAVDDDLIRTTITQCIAFDPDARPSALDLLSCPLFRAEDHSQEDHDDSLNERMTSFSQPSSPTPPHITQNASFPALTALRETSLLRKIRLRRSSRAKQAPSHSQTQSDPNIRQSGRHTKAPTSKSGMAHTVDSDDQSASSLRKEPNTSPSTTHQSSLVPCTSSALIDVACSLTINDSLQTVTFSYNPHLDSVCQIVQELQTEFCLPDAQTEEIRNVLTIAINDKLAQSGHVCQGVHADQSLLTNRAHQAQHNDAGILPSPTLTSAFDAAGCGQQCKHRPHRKSFSDFRSLYSSLGHSNRSPIRIQLDQQHPQVTVNCHPLHSSAARSRYQSEGHHISPSKRLNKSMLLSPIPTRKRSKLPKHHLFYSVSDTDQPCVDCVSFHALPSPYPVHVPLRVSPNYFKTTSPNPDPSHTNSERSFSLRTSSRNKKPKQKSVSVQTDPSPADPTDESSCLLAPFIGTASAMMKQSIRDFVKVLLSANPTDIPELVSQVAHHAGDCYLNMLHGVLSCTASSIDNDETRSTGQLSKQERLSLVQHCEMEISRQMRQTFDKLESTLMGTVNTITRHKRPGEREDAQSEPVERKSTSKYPPATPQPNRRPTTSPNQHLPKNTSALKSSTSSTSQPACHNTTHLQGSSQAILHPQLPLPRHSPSSASSPPSSPNSVTISTPHSLTSSHSFFNDDNEFVKSLLHSFDSQHSVSSKSHHFDGTTHTLPIPTAPHLHKITAQPSFLQVPSPSFYSIGSDFFTVPSTQGGHDSTGQIPVNPNQQFQQQFH